VFLFHGSSDWSRAFEYAAFENSPKPRVLHPMHLIVIAWLYVALMAALAEAANPRGTLLGAVFTFLLYGVGPVALVTYLLATPARRRALKEREARSLPPDAGGETPADPVAPIRKEP
jgi:hypothetical protein